MINQLQIQLSSIARERGKDFMFFRKYYLKHYCSIPDADFHKELTSMLSEMTVKRGSQYAIAAPRNSGKSTIVTTQYVIYCICYKLEEFIVLISSTNDQAAGALSHIKDEFEKNEKLIRDFPNVCEKGKPPRWAKNEIITRNNVKVLALGTGQQMRGRRNQEFRPTLILLDDIETDEVNITSVNFHKLEDWVTKAVFKAGTETTNVVYIGTIHNYGSLLSKFTSADAYPGWNKKIYQAVISWSGSIELWQEWELIFNNKKVFEDEQGPEAACKYFKSKESEMLLGTQVLWPQRQTYYDLMVLREVQGHYSFDSEMQNEPVNPRDCHFNIEEVHYWEDRFGLEEELLSALKGRCRIYGACDPSLGKEKRKQDYSAIVTIVIDDSTGTMYVLDADIERRLPDKTIDHILAHHQRRNYQVFGFETNQFQEFMKDELQKRANVQKSYLNITELKHTTDKLARIETLQPLVKNGTIQFCRKHRTLLEQMKYFPKGRNDDGLDALQMAAGLFKKSLSAFDVSVENYKEFMKMHESLVKSQRRII